MSDLSDKDRDAILVTLGLLDVKYQPEDEMPTVDEQRLRLLVENRLDEEDSLATCRLIASYRSWNNAYAKLIEEYESSIVKEKVPDQEQEDLGEGAIRAAIDRAIAPFRSGERELSDCDFTPILKNVEAVLFTKSLSAELRRRFYELAVDHVDELLTEHARARLSKQDDQEESSRNSTETLAGGNIETTFVVTASDAKRSLVRREELEKLREVFPDAVQYYRLRRFVSSEDVAAWFEVQQEVVEKRTKFIVAKLCSQNLGGR